MDGWGQLFAFQILVQQTACSPSKTSSLLPNVGCALQGFEANLVEIRLELKAFGQQPETGKERIRLNSMLTTSGRVKQTI